MAKILSCRQDGERSKYFRQRESRLLIGLLTMTTGSLIKCLFLDIGGVLLSNGWDHHSRKRAAVKFKLDWAEIDERHRLNFDTYEEGKLTLDVYLDRVVFYKNRTFSRAQFRKFMFSQSESYPAMIELIVQLKIRYGLKIVVVSNEGRELNAYRIQKFKLDSFVDAFISSCFVHLRKPDEDIFRLALDVAQVPARQIVYFDDTLMFVKVADNLGIKGFLHTGFESTCANLISVGLKI